MRLSFTFLCMLVYAINAFSQKGIYHFNPENAPDSAFPVFTDQPGEFQKITPLTDEPAWSTDFAVPGIAGTIYVTATDGTNLYIGGNFTTAGSTLANSIAMWDGHKWHAIGEGPENGVSGEIPSVEAMAIADGKLFIGGQFSKAGTVEVNGVAFWDGAKWNRMGSDSTNGVRRLVALGNDTIMLRGFVAALMAHNDRIYLGGNFQFAGDSLANGIAVWNMLTSGWETLDNGLKRQDEHGRVTVYSLAAHDTSIYAGGIFQFKAVGGITRNIARWNGTAWTSMGEAARYILDMSTDAAGTLYAAGYFTPGELPGGASGIGIWNGTAWSSLNGPADYTSQVSHIRFHNNELYAGGTFAQEFVSPNQSFARWDGSHWHIIEGLGQTYYPFFQAGISAIESVGYKLYVSGNFTRSGETYAVNIAEWDVAAQTWKQLDDGNANLGIYDGRTMALEQKGDILYAGGDFTVAGGTFARGIAKWNGTAWQSLGTGTGDLNGIRGLVYTILADSTDVYAGGYFDMAGGEATFHIARWDGMKWWPMGHGVGGIPGAHVRALARKGDYLYVGGYFAVVGDEENYELPANSIARYNLKTKRWESLGRGIEYNYGIPGTINDLEVHGNKIYVGGEFYLADEGFFENFAVVDGDKWSGSGVNPDVGVHGIVRKIKAIGDEIYIGGLLRKDNHGASYGIMKWNGGEWTTVGDSLSAGEHEVAVYDIVARDSGFVAGGLFTHAGEVEVNNLAYFDGHAWSSLAGGVFPGVSRLAFINNKLYMAGPVQLLHRDGPSMGIAQLNFDPPVVNGHEEIDEETDLLVVHPNPFRTATTVSFTIPAPGMVRIAVLDPQGREIRLLLNQYKPAGRYEVVFNAGGLPAGLYFCRMTHGANVETIKMVVGE